nr:UDP-N-acetylmuramoyl-L-alanine--D-glutamate ligase [Clostridia bacterium]
MTNFKNKTATVVGIGRSNLPLTKFLIERGASVTARDRKERSALGEAADTLESMGVRLICGDAYLDNITEDYIFRAPGVRYDKPEFTAAVENGSKLTSEMQLFFELCPCPIVGITGSDGKTTTTTLISLFLKAINEGRGNVWLGGNIGRPLIGDLCDMKPDDFAVVELSSFQLHTMTSSPDVSVITNVTPNHLDYHLGMDEYIAAKANIYAHQKPGSMLILNALNAVTDSMAQKANDGVDVVMFNSESGYHFDDEGIYSPERKLVGISDIILPGRHNLENYSAALAAADAAAKLCGLTLGCDTIQRIASTFPGVEHRLEFVRELDGVKYYNGSIDSSPTRTLAALSAFTTDAQNPVKLIVICGGYDKHIPYEPLAPGLCRYTKCVVLTGATGPKIKAALDAYTASSGLPDGETVPRVIEDDTFEGAVRAAHECARSGDIVLLSPASASFDRFKDFEERGRYFKQLVNEL